MSDSSKDSSPSSERETPNSSLPEGVDPPPVPDPDLLDPTELGPTYTVDQDGKRKKQIRSHPTDPYKALNKRSGCKGCGCCLGTGLLLMLGIIILISVVVGIFGPGRQLFEGYEVVMIDESAPTILEAPTEPTYYMGNQINYLAPVTNVPIAIAGTNIVISGDFHKDVTITGAKVKGMPSARFASDLEIYAAQFTDGGISLNGELKGRVINNLP